jgi:putative addiction module antidote
MKGTCPTSQVELVGLAQSCYNVRMNMTVKITKIGNSAGIVLPKEMLAHLDAQVGEVLTVAKTPGGFELRPADNDFDTQMAAARDVMARRKRALRELAK